MGSVDLQCHFLHKIKWFVTITMKFTVHVWEHTAWLKSEYTIRNLPLDSMLNVAHSSGYSSTNTAVLKEA